MAVVDIDDHRGRDLADVHVGLVVAASRLQDAFFDMLGVMLEREGYGDVRPHWALALLQLDETPSRSDQLRLAGSMGENLSYAKRKLIDSGYIAEALHGSDRRIRLIALTDRGRQFCQRFRALLAEQAADLAGEHGPHADDALEAETLLRRCAREWRYRADRQ